MFENTENMQLIDGSGVHSVCFRGDFAIKTTVARGFYAKTRLKMLHTFKLNDFIQMQYFLLLTNLVVVFVYWVSTGVLYKPRQCSLFWDYIPEYKLCFCLNMCRSPGTYSIRPIQKLLNCQTTARNQKQRRGSEFAK